VSSALHHQNLEVWLVRFEDTPKIEVPVGTDKEAGADLRDFGGVQDRRATGGRAAAGSSKYTKAERYLGEAALCAAGDFLRAVPRELGSGGR